MSVDQKHLAEARLGILSILHTIMSSVTLLWSILHQADNSDKPAAATAASTSNINLGSTKVPQTANVPYITKCIQSLIQMIEFRCSNDFHVHRCIHSSTFACRLLLKFHALSSTFWEQFGDGLYLSTNMTAQ